MGYGRFKELFEGETPSATQAWSTVVLNFVLDLEDVRPDFRRTRIDRLVVHLVDLLERLEGGKTPAYLLEARDLVRLRLPDGS